MCHFPAYWKLANIIPIPKDKIDFRPISLLPIPGKILEKIFIRYVLFPLLRANLKSHQFGFIPDCFGGCSNALTQMRLWTLCKLADNGGYVRALALDLSKAFDKVSHKIIIDSLSTEFNIPQHCLQFIGSFLSERWQRVISNDGSEPSSWCKVSSGVPQGSILGPLLFVCVVNSIPLVSDRSRLIAYADDITILHHVPPNHNDELQADASAIFSWCSEKKLVINFNKSHTMCFSRSKTKPTVPNIIINNFSITVSLSTKILGMVFSGDCKPIEHFEHVVRKYMTATFAIKKLWLAGCKGWCLWHTYLGLAFCHIAYAWPAWCDIPQTNLRKIEKMEKMIWMWSNLPGDPSPLQKRLNQICKRLMSLVSKHDTHPLREFFGVRNCINTNLRKRHNMLPISFKGTQLRNSFLKFYTDS